MAAGFVAILRSGSPADRAALLAAGATAVVGWGELAAGPEPGDGLAVLFDLVDAADLAGHLADLPVVLSRLAVLTAAGPGPKAVATVRPVTDTLKLVDAAGVLAGTADREDHRFVGTPIATRLDLLRALSRDGVLDASPGRSLAGAPDGALRAALGADPSPAAVLAALAGRGVTVVAGLA